MTKKKKIIISIVSIVLALILTLTIVLVCVNCNSKDVDLTNDKIPETEIDLVLNGKSDYVIVIPEESTLYEDYAAEELQLYLKEATNVELQIINDSGKSFNDSDKVISVGETNIYAGSGLTVPYEEFKRDGFKIKRFNNTLVLCGGGGYGTLYAVYEFLFRQIDWEAYAPDEIYYKKATSVKVLDFDLADKPAIENRSGGWWVTYSDSYFAAKWRTFAGKEYMLFNEKAWYYYPHALFKIVNPVEYADEHPDWFSTSLKQPCFSSEGFRNQLILGIKDLIINNPSLIYIPIGPEDALNATCSCSDCLSEVEKYSYSGLVVRWANSVVEELENWRVEQGIEREIYYPVLAYYETKTPPIDRNVSDGEFKPIDPSCVLNKLSPVLYAPIDADFSRPLSDETYNKAAINDLNGWLACSESFMGYYYNCDFFKRFEWPDPISSTVQNYKLAADVGAVFLGDDASSASYQACAFQTMLCYVYSKVMWNPNVDITKLINNYITHYFKDAKDEMIEYYYLMETTRTAIRDANDAKGVDTTEKDWLTKGLLERSKQLIKSGIDKVKNNSNYTAQQKEEYVRRLELELLTPLVYILDYFYNDYTKYEYLSLVDEVEQLVNKYGLIITANYSNSKTNEQKYTEWRGNKK